MDQKHSNAPVMIVISLFFMWGFITVLVDSLIPRLREVFELNYFQAGLVQFAFFIAYGLVSLPAGWLLARIGYQRGMILGLAVMGLGCLLFWPAAGYRVFGLFMLGYFTLASGMTILQVAANPYITALGTEAGASSRLNLAQAFNSVGTTIAPIVGASFLLSDHIMDSMTIEGLNAVDKAAYFVGEASAVQLPFLILAAALVTLAVVVGLIHLPKILDGQNSGSFGEAVKNGRLMRGVLGIFLYVGAEVAIGSYLVNYFLSMDLAEPVRNSGAMVRIADVLGKDLATMDAKGVVGVFVALYWGGAMVGRFVGSYLTRVVQPATVLMFFGLFAIGALSLSMATTGVVSLWSILAVGLFNSVMFPTIFSLAIEGLGPLKPQGSGLLCTAICGGAFIPPLLGLWADHSGFKTAFLLVVCCYLYITFFAWKERRTTVLS